MDAEDGTTVCTRPGRVGSKGLVEFAPGCGLIDGACMDSEGGIWLASYGGGHVLRFVDGEEVARVEVPTKYPTCCCLGGPDFKTLFITTASTHAAGGDPDLDIVSPDAGAVFQARIEVPGVKESRFG